ncbi:hypothetical protein KTAU_30030 [Thermogemmatispora aurantia]|nr:hypothetical protein KTAU_30030 [Thermogemmatispora aurantia]
MLLLQHCEHLGQRAESQGQARLAMWRGQLGQMIGVMVLGMATGELVALLVELERRPLLRWSIRRWGVRGVERAAS